MSASRVPALVKLGPVLVGALTIARVAGAQPVASGDHPSTDVGSATPTVSTPSPHPITYPLVLLAQGDAVLSSDPAGTGAAAGNDPPFGSGVRLRRLRLGDDVSQGAWRARVLLEAVSRGQPFLPTEGGRIPVGGSVRLTEAFGTWSPHRAFQLTLGPQRVPFSLSRQVDEADLRLPERAQILTAVAPDYRTGVTVASDLGLLQLRIAAMSADTGLDHRLLTSGFFGALRLSADPIGPMGTAPWRRRSDDPWYDWWRFSAGVSLVYGTLLGPRTLAVGGDAQLQWRRVTVTGEYVGEHAFVGSGSWPRQGAVVEPGVFLWRERLELVLRGAWYRRLQEVTADPGDTTNTLAGGVGLTFFSRAAHVRLQAALEHRRTLDDAQASDSSWAIFRATLAI
jgi:hypothetical protein